MRLAACVGSEHIVTTAHVHLIQALVAGEEIVWQRVDAVVIHQESVQRRGRR